MKHFGLVLFAFALFLIPGVQDAEAGRCPTNCVSWFDGCNTCGCKNGRITYCTKKYCSKKSKAYCKQSKSCPTCRTMRCKSGYTCRMFGKCGKCVKKPSKKCPRNCAVWYDGCNTCKCVRGRVTACTRRMCVRYSRPYCKKKACPTCSTMRCKVGYTCKNIRGCGKCVRKACPTCKTMRCKRGYTCKMYGRCGKCVKQPSNRCPMRCKVWHDGCNDCRCVRGFIKGCTKRACIRKGRAYCKQR